MLAAAVLPDVVGALAGQGQWLFPGFSLTLYRDEAEGYYLNESNPQAFVWIKMAEQSAVAATDTSDTSNTPDTSDTPDTPEFAPVEATLSYHEASRWMDGGERVDAVADGLVPLGQHVGLGLEAVRARRRLRHGRATSGKAATGSGAGADARRRG